MSIIRVRLHDKINKDKSFSKNCKEFYFKKTYKRVDQFLKNNKSLDDRHFIYKKIQLLKVKNILKNIDWRNISNGIPKFIHGDLQFDNILKISSKKYKLIDWRPTFGKSIEITHQKNGFVWFMLFQCFD